MELEFFHEKGQATRRELLKKKLKELSFRKVIYYIFIFFISAANFRVWSPSMGCAVFAAEYTGQVPVFTAIIVLISGSLGRMSAMRLLESALSILLFGAWQAKFKMKSPVKKGIMMAVCNMFCSSVPQVFSALVFYDAVLILLEGVVVFVCTVLFAKAKEVIFSLRDTAPESGEVAAVGVFFAAAVLGTGNFSFYGVNVSAFFCALATLIFAFRNRTGAGTVFGVLMGMVMGVSTGDMPQSVFTLSLSAMFSAFFAKYGKASSAISFLLAVMVATIFASSTAVSFINLSLMSGAVMVFMLIPEKTLVFLDVFSADKEKYNKKFKNYISGIFINEAETIKDIADVFKDLSRRPPESESAAAAFFERTTHSLCGECSKRNFCWKSEFHRTYTSFFVLLEICNKKGQITFSDIPQDLVRKCERTGAFVGTFNNMYELYKADRLWECRMMENRCMVSKQLECISENIKNRAEESLSDITFINDAENEIIRKGRSRGLDIEDVSVCVKNRRDKKVFLTFRGNMGEEEAEKTVCEVMGERFRCVLLDKNKAVLSCFPENEARFAIVQKSKENNVQNGDSGLFTYLDNGRFMMVLSDGMGSGERAGCDSRAVAALSKKLLRGGFDASSSAEIINSALLLKSSETAFASMDMALLNFFEMEAHFYKMGAAPAFIKRGDKVITICAATLPAGTFTKSDVGTVTQNIEKGDAVILVSDGISGGENTEELEKFISLYSGENPEDLGNRIINYCCPENEKNRDDMTVMVAFIA